jgi:hypothetical protein
MFVCVYSVFVLSSVLRQADPPSKESYRLCIGLRKLKRRPKPNKRALEPNEEIRKNQLYLVSEVKKTG